MHGFSPWFPWFAYRLSHLGRPLPANANFPDERHSFGRDHGPVPGHELSLHMLPALGRDP